MMKYASIITISLAVMLLSCKKEEDGQLTSVNEMEYDVIYEIPMNNAQNSLQEFNQLNDDPILDKNGNIIILAQTFINSDSRQVLARADNMNSNTCFKALNGSETARSVFYDAERDEAFVEIVDIFGSGYLIFYASGSCDRKLVVNYTAELGSFFPSQTQNFILTLERLNDKVYVFGLMYDDQGIYQTWVLEYNNEGEVTRKFTIPKVATLEAKPNAHGSFDVFGESSIHSNWVQGSLDKEFNLIDNKIEPMEMLRRGISSVYRSTDSFFYDFGFNGALNTITRYSLKGKLINTFNIPGLPARMSSIITGFTQDEGFIIAGTDQIDNKALNFVRLDSEGNITNSKYLSGLSSSIQLISGVTETADGDIIVVFIYEKGDSPFQVSTNVGFLKTKLE